MTPGDRVKILTCPGWVWRGGVGTVVDVRRDGRILHVQRDGDESDDLICDEVEHFEPLEGNTA